MKPSAYDGLDDQQLARLFKTRGDQMAFETLLHRHEPGLVRYCAQFLRDRSAAEDVSQVAFSRVARHIETFLGEHFSGWLYRIARNECLNLLAKQQRTELLREALASTLAQESGRESHPLEEMLRAELPLLRKEQRICLELFYMEGWSYEEVARVKSHLQNGRKALRMGIERRRRQEERAGRDLTRRSVGPAPAGE